MLKAAYISFATILMFTYAVVLFGAVAQGATQATRPLKAPNGYTAVTPIVAGHLVDHADQCAPAHATPVWTSSNAFVGFACFSDADD